MVFFDIVTRKSGFNLTRLFSVSNLNYNSCLLANVTFLPCMNSYYSYEGLQAACLAVFRNNPSQFKK